MIKFQELNPSNARIYLSNVDGKPSCRFEYVNKKSAWVHVTRLVFNYFVILDVPIFVFMLIFGVNFTTTVVVINLALFLPICLLLIYTPLVRLMPYLNYYLAFLSSPGVGYVKVRKLETTRFEVPVFANVKLDLKTRGDFRKYFKEMEIVELKFQYKVRRFFRKKPTLAVQDQYWKAVFKFSRIPRKGYLEIEFL